MPLQQLEHHWADQALLQQLLVGLGQAKRGCIRRGWDASLKAAR